MNTKTIVICVIALILGFIIFYLLKSVCGCNNIVEGQLSRLIDQEFAAGARMGRSFLESDAAESSVMLGSTGVDDDGLRGQMRGVENDARVATGDSRLTDEEYNEEFNHLVDMLTARWQRNHVGELMFMRAEDEICQKAGNFASWIGQDTDMDNVETANICVDILNSVFDCTSTVIQIAFPESELVVTQDYINDVGELVTSSMEAGTEYATNRNILDAMDQSNLSVAQKLAKKAHSGRVVNSVMSCNGASTYKAWRETNADRLNIPGCYGSYLPDETEDQPSNYKDCHSEYLRRRQFGQTTDISDTWCINKSGCNLVKKISPCMGVSAQNSDELCTSGYNRVLNNTYSNDPNKIYREANRWCNESQLCRLDQSQADTNLSEEIQVNDYSSSTIKDINPIFLEHMLTSHDIIIEIRRYLNEENHPDIINLKGDNNEEIINRISNINGLNNSTLLIKETVLGNEDQRAEINISHGLIDLDLTGSLSHNGHIDASTSIDSISDPTSGTEVSNNDISESIDRLLKQYKYLIYKYRGNTELIRTKLNNFFQQNSIESESVNNNVADNLSNLFNNSDMLDNALHSRILDHWLDTLPRHMNSNLDLIYEHAKRLLGITNNAEMDEIADGVMNRATEAAEEMEDKIERFMSAGPTTGTALNVIQSGLQCDNGIKGLINKFRGVEEAGEEVAEISESASRRVTKLIGSLGPAADCASDIYNLFQDARNAGVLTFTNMSNMIRYTHYIQNFCKVLEINNDVIHNGTLGMIKVGKPRHTGDPIEPMESMIDPGKMTLGQTPPIGSTLIDSSFTITEDNIDIMNEGHNNHYEVGDEVSLFYVPEPNPDRFWVLLSIISYLKQFVTIFETMGFLPSDYDEINSELPNLISSAESAEQVPRSPSQQSDSSSAPHACDVITTDLFTGDTGTFTNSMRDYCKTVYDSYPAQNCNERVAGGWRDYCIQDNQHRTQLRNNALDTSKYIKYYNTVNDITGSRFSDDESRDIGASCISVRDPFELRDTLDRAGALNSEYINTMYDVIANQCISDDNNIVRCYTSCSELAERKQTDFQEFIENSLENDRITQDQLQQTTSIYEQLSIDGQPSIFQTVVGEYPSASVPPPPPPPQASHRSRGLMSNFRQEVQENKQNLNNAFQMGGRF